MLCSLVDKLSSLLESLGTIDSLQQLSHEAKQKTKGHVAKSVIPVSASTALAVFRVLTSVWRPHCDNLDKFSGRETAKRWLNY